MNNKHLLIGAVILVGSISVASIFVKHNDVNTNISIDESLEESNMNSIKSIDFNNKTVDEMREYYSNEGLEFIKRIYPDSVSSDFALLNTGKHLTEELKDIKFTTVNNDVIELKKLKGKKIILDFALTNCGTCKSEATFLSKYNFDKEDIVFLHIFPRESTHEIKNMLKEVEGDFNSKHIVSSTGTNGFTFEDLNITNVPAKIFIDENGIVQYTFVGGITDEETLQLHLERAFDDETPKMLDYLK